MKSITRIFRRIFWCRHIHMSRCYAVNDELYHSCLDCGARRRLNWYAWTKLHPNYF